MAELSREIHLKEFIPDVPSESSFKVVEVPVPELGAGEILVRNIWMSVDPYMRGRMREKRGGASSFQYISAFEVGRPLEGNCVGRVVESRSSEFSEGDYVTSMCGWREYWVSDGKGVGRVDPEMAPLSSFLGVLGPTGLTAYIGLMKIGELKKGDAVFVSAAAGAVGSVACQLAKLHGCYVVGSAGSQEKIDWLRTVAGVDYAFDYREVDDVLGELRGACPDGIDVYFDNVGGRQLEAALAHMKEFGRVVLCGMIEQYNAEELPPGPRTLLQAVTRRLKLQGFIVSDHWDAMEEYRKTMSKWIEEGRVHSKETVVEGIENAPAAFIALFKGENVGKMLVKVGPDPGQTEGMNRYD